MLEVFIQKVNHSTFLYETTDDGFFRIKVADFLTYDRLVFKSFSLITQYYNVSELLKNHDFSQSSVKSDIFSSIILFEKVFIENGKFSANGYIHFSMYNPFIKSAQIYIQREKDKELLSDITKGSYFEIQLDKFSVSDELVFEVGTMAEHYNIQKLLEMKNRIQF